MVNSVVDTSLTKSQDFEKKIPTYEEIIDLMEKWELPVSIREHCMEVRDISCEIIEKISEKNRETFDTMVVKAGALLHDIGRVQTHGLEHGYIGGKLLEKINTDPRVVRCAQVHVLGGFTLEDIKNHFPVNLKEEIEEALLPVSIEEKIVCFADKHAIGTKRVSVRKRFNRWFKKHGRTPFLLKSRYRLLQIEKELKALV